MADVCIAKEVTEITVAAAIRRSAAASAAGACRGNTAGMLSQDGTHAWKRGLQFSIMGLRLSSYGIGPEPVAATERFAQPKWRLL